jgi:AraC family transcriptional activator of pobA
VTLQDGARLFVASHALGVPQLSGVRRYSFYALAWLRGGGATFGCDTERFEVAPQSLICIAPGQVNWWEQAESGAHLTLLGFVPGIFTGGALDLRLLTDLPLFQPDRTTVLAATAEAGAALDTLFGQVWQRYLHSAAAAPQQAWLILPRQREGLLLAYLHAILAEAATLSTDSSAASLTLARTAEPTPEHSAASKAEPSKAEHSAEPKADQRADLRLTRLFRMHAVDSALQRHPVTYYAALLHVTPDHLARVVRRVTGQPPSAWLQARVLIEAVRLLTFTALPTAHIAEQLAFPSATQFSQWFRARSGQTPRQVRQGGFQAGPDAQGKPDSQQF